MMRDLFITQHNGLLGNWKQAFPEAVFFATVEALDHPVADPCVFWLHTNKDHQAWLSKQIALIQGRYLQAKVIVLANAPDLDEAKVVLSQGVLGYCHAYSEAQVLQEVKAVISHGGIWLGQDFLLHLIGVGIGLVGNKPEKVTKTLSMLTPREQDVAKQAALGLSNKEIARVLSITERTVKAHLSSSFDRLGIKDRLQLALMLNDKTS